MNKILIVDDYIPIQILYADALTEAGYEVITTCHDAGLLQLVEKARPDLVVLDIRLGESSGLDLLQEIRNNYDLPVILCSAYPASKHDLKSIAADYFVGKNSDLGELKAKIKMALENHDQPSNGPIVTEAQQIASGPQDAI